MTNGNIFEKNLTIVFILIIICLGMMGNLLNMIVLGSKSMRKTSTFRFLLYLSIIDMLVLLVCTTDVLLAFGFYTEIRLTSTLTCRLHTFLTYYLTHTSSIVLMAVSVERVFFIFDKATAAKSKLNRQSKTIFEFLQRHVLKYNRIDTIMIIILTVLALINSHFLFYLNINLVDLKESNANISRFDTFYGQSNFQNASTENLTTNLSINPIIKLEANASSHQFKSCFPVLGTIYSNFLNKYWIWVDISLYSLIPFIVMVICTVLIFWEIRKKAVKLSKSASLHNKSITTKRVKKNYQIFLMLTGTNLFFIFCSLPYCIQSVLLNQGHEVNQKFSFIVHLLSYMNNSVNFIFYGLFSERYRQEFSHILRKSSNGNNNGNLSLIKSSRHTTRTTRNFKETNKSYRNDSLLNNARLK